MDDDFTPRIHYGEVPQDVNELFDAPQVQDAIERISRLAPGIFIGGNNLSGEVEQTANPAVKRAELTLFYELDTPTVYLEDALTLSYIVWVDDYELTLVLTPVEIFNEEYSNEDGEFDSYDDDDLSPYGTI